VILVADRSLLGPENIGELTAPADRGGRRMEFILAVPTRRHADPVPTFGALDFGEDGLAEAIFADHRPIVAHDHVRAAERSEHRRSRIAGLEGGPSCGKNGNCRSAISTTCDLDCRTWDARSMDEAESPKCRNGQISLS